MNEFEALFEDFRKNHGEDKRSDNDLRICENRNAQRQYFTIHPNRLLEYLNPSIPQEKLLIDEETFYVCDLSKYTDTPYNTLIFQINGLSFKSTETTTLVMNRYFNARTPYHEVQKIGKLSGITHKCPYVLGQIQFAPDKGISKNHANWIAMHHVTNINHIQERILLSITNHHELILNLTFKSMAHIVEQTVTLYDTQYRFSKDWSELFKMTRNIHEPLTMIERLHNEKLSREKLPSSIAWQTRLVYTLSYSVLASILKEGNPYLDDIKNIFSLNNDEFI